MVQNKKQGKYIFNAALKGEGGGGRGSRLT